MLITKRFKHCIHKWYSCDDCNVYRSCGERITILELDECGSTLSLSVYDSNSERGFDTQSVCNATIESWNENVLIFKGAIGRVGVKIEIELDSQNGDIVKLTEHYSNGGYLMLTNDDSTLQNEIIELQNKQVREYDSSR
jgi:hypothetical protein